MTAAWDLVPFESAVTDISSKGPTVAQSEYLRSGTFPIVDQGKKPVAGFTDNPALLHGAKSPAIIFGDHTRIFKYVDFPFCVGAQGVKVLQPADGFEPRFLFHYLRQLKIPASGYSRHFKVLREFGIVRPPTEVQHHIADVLDRADSLRARRREAIGWLNELAQSIFIEIFGDPASNPGGWPVQQISDLTDSVTYGTSERADIVGELPVLRMGNLTTTGEVDLGDLKFLPRAATPDKHIVRRGDILFNRTNSPDLVGKTALYRGDEPLAYAGYLIRVRTNGLADAEYVAAFLNTPYAKRVLRGMCKTIIGMANINAKQLQSINIPVPPLDRQRRFARTIQEIVKLRATQRGHLAELDKLFASLQHRAFRGEL
ncbi:restriction endonuclease subunit S [Pseudofrankia saprophytica]|uniref:restriction endonuclease subunit S n=1 Tax=Pseudofrankia saprophytica TaxID=298655 RepID=UPI000234B9EE|nr:restriction endonuclease subunit S [Pseudofrankia saprophytica]